MIGLETIQIFQLFYFTKMVVSQRSTALLNSLNSLQYSANGYTNGPVLLNIDTHVGSALGDEKYNVVDPDSVSCGGEYPVQDGFGWSNGVYLAMKKWLAENK